MAADIQFIVMHMVCSWRWMYEKGIKDIQPGIKSSGAGFCGKR